MTSTETAAEMAQLAALTIELRPDAGHVRQRTAIEVLAEGLPRG